MTVQLSITADRFQQKLSGLGAMADADRRAVEYKLKDRGLLCCLLSLGLLYFLNPWFPGASRSVMQIILGHRGSTRWRSRTALVSIKWWAVL